MNPLAMRNWRLCARYTSSEAHSSITVGIKVTGLELAPAHLRLAPGVSAPLTLTILPADAANKTVTWESADPAIATVDEVGVVTGVAEGNTVITATASDGVHSAQTVVLVGPRVTGVSIGPAIMSLTIGSTGNMTAEVEPENAVDQTVVWTSSAPEIVTVSQTGELTAVGQPGQAIITVVTDDGGLSASATVVVGLYEYSAHTFTTCGKTGNSGPALSQCRAAYAASSWAGNDQYLNVAGGIHLWTVPWTGTYRIEAKGAKGGSSGSLTGGSGASMAGDFQLEAGQKLRLLVGQRGGDGSKAGGGSGGSFVTTEFNDALIVAGGGGGVSSSDHGNKNAIAGVNANSGCRGTSSCGAGGVGGGPADGGRICESEAGSGGGGFNSNGQDSVSGGQGGGRAFLNAGAGGLHYQNNAGNGGFGGGGGASGYSKTILFIWTTYYYGGGGGGGWAGGGGGHEFGVGGGGGSYNTGTNQLNLADASVGDGSILITLLEKK